MNAHESIEEMWRRYRRQEAKWWLAAAAVMIPMLSMATVVAAKRGEIILPVCNGVLVVFWTLGAARHIRTLRNR